MNAPNRRSTRARGAGALPILLVLAACASDRSPPPAAPPAPRPEPATPPPAAQAQDPGIARAYAALDRGDFGPAHDAFLSCAAAGPRAAECAYGAGLASTRMGQADRGREELDRAIAAIERTTGATLRVAWARGFGSWGQAVAFSPNGALLGVAGRPEAVIYDARTLTERVRLAPARPENQGEGSPDWLSAFAWSPDGATFAAGAVDKLVLLGDALTGKQLPAPTTHTDAVEGVAFSADGLFASTSRDETTRVVRLADHKEMRTIKHRCASDAGVVAFLDQGRTLVLGRCGVVQIEPVGDGKGRSFPDLPDDAPLSEQVQVLAVDRSSGQILAGRGARVEAFDAATGALAGGWPAKSPAAQDYVETLAVSADGLMVALGTALGHLRVFRREGDVTLVESDEGSVPYVAFDPAGATLAVVQGEDLQVRDLASRSRRTAARAARTLGLATRGSVAAVLEDDGVRVWDLGGARAPVLIRSGAAAAAAVAFSDDGRLLAVGDAGGGVRLWSVEGRAELWSIPGDGDAVVDLAFDPGAHRLLATQTHVVMRRHTSKLVTSVVAIRDAASGKEIAHLAGGGAPCGAFFSHLGRKAWLVDQTGALLPLPMKGGSLGPDAPSHRGFCGFARHPTRDLVALGTDGAGGIVLRDLATGKADVTLDTGGGLVRHLAWSPDGKRIAAVLDLGDVAVWSADRPSAITFDHDAVRRPSGIAFTADGTGLWRASEEGGLSRTSASKGPLTLTLLGVRADDAAFAVDASGHVQRFGAGEAALLCGFGPVTYPFDLCRHRLEKGAN